MTQSTLMHQPEDSRKTVTFCNTVQVRRFKEPPLPMKKARNGKRYIPKDALLEKYQDVFTDGTVPIHDPDRTPKKVMDNGRDRFYVRAQVEKKLDTSNNDCCIDDSNGMTACEIQTGRG